MNIELAGEYLVNKVLKKSKARYAEGIESGDKLKFVLEMVSTTGASSGNYVLYADLYVNNKLKSNISQNEFYKLLQIFDLSVINNE